MCCPQHLRIETARMKWDKKSEAEYKQKEWWKWTRNNDVQIAGANIPPGLLPVAVD